MESIEKWIKDNLKEDCYDDGYDFNYGYGIGCGVGCGARQSTEYIFDKKWGCRFKE